MQEKNAVDEEDGLGFHLFRLLETLTWHVIEDWDLHCLPFSQLTDMVDHQVEIERIWMIIVEIVSLRQRHVSLVFIVRILVHGRYLLVNQGEREAAACMSFPFLSPTILRAQVSLS